MTKENTKDWKKVKEKIELEIEENENNDEPENQEAKSSKGALEHPGYTALEEKLTLAEQQAHENWEKSVRVMAELDNVRRRAERDVTNAHRYGSEKLITSLLPVVDSLEQALQLVDENTQSSMREGLALTMKLFLDALAKQDVTQIDPQGELFNPQEHEAMSMVPSTDVAPNTIMAVFQKGYRLNDRIIRPARVIVAKAIG